MPQKNSFVLFLLACTTVISNAGDVVQCSKDCFLCKNVDFRPVNISKSQVGDLKCDCCDGSDENSVKPGTCSDTCKRDAIEFVKQRAEEKRGIQEGIEIRSAIVRRSYRRIASWKNELKFLMQDLTQLQKLRERIVKRRYQELAIERFEAEILFDAEEEEEKDDEKDDEDVEWVFKKVDGRFMAVREEFEISNDEAVAKASILDKYKEKIAERKNIKVVKVHNSNQNKNEEDDLVIDLGELEQDEAAAAPPPPPGSSEEKSDVNNNIKIKAVKEQIVKEESTVQVPSKKKKNTNNKIASSGCKLTRESNVHNGGKRISRAKFIVNGNDTLLLKDFLNSDPFMPVGDFIATKAKWRDEGSIFSLSMVDIATLLSGDPKIIDDNRYHHTVTYKKRHAFMGSIFNGGQQGWNRGFTYILSGIGIILSPIRIVYEIMKLTISYVNHGLYTIPYFPETAGFAFSTWNRTATKIYNVTNTPEVKRAHETYRSLIALPLWIYIGIPIRRTYRRLHGPWVVEIIWDVLPQLYVYMYPNYKKDHKRAEVAVLEDCMSLLAIEEQRLSGDIHDLERYINMDYGPHKSHFELSQNCYNFNNFKRNDVKYEIEFCPFYNITMQRNDKKSVLGKWYGWDLTSFNSDEEIEDTRYRTLRYRKGDICDGGEAVVNGVCGPKSEIVNVDEGDGCSFTLLFRSPAFCESHMLEKYNDIEDIQALKKKHFSKRDEL